MVTIEDLLESGQKIEGFKAYLSTLKKRYTHPYIHRTNYLNIYALTY